MKNITIIGSGSFGCALAHAFEKKNLVKIWSYTKEEQDSINLKHTCLQIPSIKLSDKTRCYTDYKESIEGSDIVVLALPSIFIRSTCKEIKEYIKDKEIILVSKGLENDKLLSTVIKEELNIDVNVLMGPSFAIELGNDYNTYVDFYGNKELIKELESDTLHLSYCDDMIGMQVSSALKNIITIMIGITEGLGYGINTKSYVFTEGYKEIREIGLKLGAKNDTFLGLSGIGDLYLTSIGDSSRNKRAGILLGKGMKLDYIYKEVSTTIEGLNTLKDAKYIVDKYNLDCKLINNLYDIVFNNKEAKYII